MIEFIKLVRAYINESWTSCLQISSILGFIYSFIFLGPSSLLISFSLCYHIAKLSYDIGWTIYQRNLWTNMNLQTFYELSDLKIKLGCLFVESSLVLSYLIHWYKDYGAEIRGSHPRSWSRNARIWQYVASYFPMRLEVAQTLRNANNKCNNNNNNKEEEKSNKKPEQDEQRENEKFQIEPIFHPKKNYLVGYHPHGIMGMGAFINFATEATGFTQRFPGMKSWLATANINFRVPILRDTWMTLKLVPATYEGINYLLDSTKCGSTGNVVVIACGGASEALDSRPADYILHIKKHFGIFKLALLTGTDLVPCVSFGEPNMYKQVWNPKGSLLRRFQEGFLRFLTVSNPFFYARCQIIPYRTPVTTILGDPISVEKHDKPTREQVAGLKERYLKAWTDLFNEFRETYDPNAKDVLFV